MNEHEKWIRACIDLAKKAKNIGRYPVGALIVEGNKILTSGYEGESNLPAAIAHAEMVAIIKAIQVKGNNNLSNCILYSTKEPCFMCSYLIRQTHVASVVYGCNAGQIGGNESAFPFLASDKFSNWAEAPEIVKGVLEEECRRLTED